MISSLTYVTTAVPLFGVFTVTAIKDAYDDIVRNDERIKIFGLFYSNGKYFDFIFTFTGLMARTKKREERPFSDIPNSADARVNQGGKNKGWI